jgi:predicted PurR-regulated permease PerM
MQSAATPVMVAILVVVALLLAMLIGLVVVVAVVVHKGTRVVTDLKATPAKLAAAASAVLATIPLPQRRTKTSP